MQLPVKHRQIVDELLKAVKSKPNRPPTLIKGSVGSGKSWLIYEIVSQLKKDFKNTGLWPVYIPLQLSAYKLAETINSHVNFERSIAIKSLKNGAEPAKYRSIIILENIDILFNLPTSTGTFLRPKKIGRGSTQYSQIQYANELRRYLIENSSKVSILATANDNTSFIEDPEQPFYEYFNILELDALDNQQCTDYVKDSLKDFLDDKEVTTILSAFNAFSSRWILNITDGKISLLNSLVDAIVRCQFSKKIKGKGNLTVDSIIESYFMKITPIQIRILDSLAYSERVLLDQITFLQNSFLGSEASIKEFNSSLSIQQLCKKEILEKEGIGKQSTYRLKSMALKAWLRFSKKTNLYEVIDPVKKITTFVKI